MLSDRIYRHRQRKYKEKQRKDKKRKRTLTLATKCLASAVSQWTPPALLPDASVSVQVSPQRFSASHKFLKTSFIYVSSLLNCLVSFLSRILQNHTITVTECDKYRPRIFVTLSHYSVLDICSPSSKLQIPPLSSIVSLSHPNPQNRIGFVITFNSSLRPSSSPPFLIYLFHIFLLARHNVLLSFSI